MKQALERIIELVGRVDRRSSSLEIESTLRSIAQTAHMALGQPTILSSSPLAEPRLLPVVTARPNGV